MRDESKRRQIYRVVSHDKPLRWRVGALGEPWQVAAACARRPRVAGSYAVYVIYVRSRSPSCVRLYIVTAMSPQ